ncbi:SGNH/GDSL hydrolase family protein [Salinibacterium sp. SWN1162]|uniref:SGNH/GDSL hydrolase family protein n=1 Tax=Salinibacterium sp. SWN1162 TaxID=2792053 RepID=UPI0018CEABB8|nr:SGNH/GDSL hydrolase family protein [Salinibacterium sp. SWN1162]MBH0009808.1 SGNH/GDSL hydrolase family protein [Salinibacterium sp. SWN1162]
MRSGFALRALALAVTAAVALGLSSCAAVPEETTAVTAFVAEPEPLRVAFYGDSYTKGVGASEEALRWSTLVSQKLGWEEVNPSVSGLGFMRKRELFSTGDVPSIILAADPDVVLVTLGLNDNFTYDEFADELPGQILSDFQRLSIGLPNARLIVVEPFWYKSERPESVEIIISWVHDAAVAVDAEYIAGASHWLDLHPEWMALDDLHPNDAGHAAIAARMTRELRIIGF